MTTWLRQIRIYKQPQLLTIFLLGIISGLPFLLTLSTLSFWLAESGINKTTMGLFILVSVPYSLKFLWAPFTDYFSLPYFTKRLGIRRSWGLASQTGLLFSLIVLAHCDPSQSIAFTAISAFCVSFFSASQDIVIDAYRIEILKADSSGAGAALEAIGFNFGMMTSGAGALYLAHAYTWRIAYLTMTLGVICGMIIFCRIKEPHHTKVTPLLRKNKTSMPWRHWLHNLFIVPWSQLSQKNALIYCFAFIFCFKMGDTVLNAMCAPFLCDLEFSKLEYATVTKIFGIGLMVFGGLMGGIIIHQFGILQSTIMCVCLQSISCLMFAIQSLIGHHLGVLIITVGVESFCSGMTSTIFIAYISSLCRQPYTATHFTLLYSFGSFCRVIISTLAGWSADRLGWTPLFLASSTLIIPALYILMKLTQLEKQKHHASDTQLHHQNRERIKRVFQKK